MSIKFNNIEEANLEIKRLQRIIAAKEEDEAEDMENKKVYCLGEIKDSLHNITYVLKDILKCMRWNN
jgi:hypothetical protein